MSTITEVTSTSQEPEQRIFTFKATQLIWLLLGILEVTIALRIMLLLIGANPESGIVVLIYALTAPFLFPFTGLVASPSAGAMVLEVSSMFAMVIYALLAWVAERIVWLIFYRPRTEVTSVIENAVETTEEDNRLDL